MPSSFFILPLFLHLFVGLFIFSSLPSFLPSSLSILFLSSGFRNRMNAKGCRDDYSPYFAVIYTLRGTGTQM
jgi:hypothetical protein